MTTAAHLSPVLSIPQPVRLRPPLPPLAAGDLLTREQFLARWDAMPSLKHAELIHGVVYMPSPTSVSHGDSESLLGTVFGVYSANTPGTRSNHQSTLLMAGDNAPQSDVHLRILPEFGGQTRLQGPLLAGAPEFCAEISGSSAAYDLHPKLQLYQAAGVREYLVLLLWEREVRLHRLGPDGRYEQVPVDAGGVLRSAVFPGLWLNVPALLAGDGASALHTLHSGLASSEHADFVRALADRYRPTGQSSDAQS